MKKLTLTLLLLILFCFFSYPQSINVKKLDSLFEVLQNHSLGMGSVAISINGKVEYQKAIGFALLDSSKSVAANINTKYRIGSISKMFTAVIIFQLIDEGKIKLEQKLDTYFPQVPNANKITISDMLYHRSGLHDYTHDTNFSEWMDKPKSHEEMLNIITEKGTDFEPGTRAEYCNTNYLLLSYIIERVCKMPYAEALGKRITSKIGLSNTYYGKPIDINRNESASYKYDNGIWEKEKETDMSIHCGAGSIVSTATDLVKFIEQLFSGKLISQSSLKSMITMIDGYGMGIFPYDFDNKKGYGHNGRIEEFYSAVRYYPEKKLAVSYITNGILYPRTDILDGIFKICFNDTYSIPFSRSMQLKNSNLNNYIGKYISKDLPFDVICNKDNDKLEFEAKGKVMEAVLINKNYFMNLKTGTFFDFNPQKGGLKIKETDEVYYLQKTKN
jgi:CubicO group peptidase (beta-lactamase class C family)